MKNVRLFCSNLIASLRRTLLVDALCGTFSLDKSPHHVKVSLIKGAVIVLGAKVKGALLLEKKSYSVQ